MCVQFQRDIELEEEILASHRGRASQPRDLYSVFLQKVSLFVHAHTLTCTRMCVDEWILAG